MSDKNDTQDKKPVDLKKTGRISNEPEQRPDKGTEHRPEKIGVMKNETPGKADPSGPKVGRTDNQRSDTLKTTPSPIGRVKNDPGSK